MAVIKLKKTSFLIMLPFLVLVNAESNCHVIPDCVNMPNIGDKLLVTEEDVTNECSDLKNNLECAQTWMKECAMPDVAEAYNSNINKPLKFIRALCGNQKFRDEYLTEKESFTKIADDWKKCLNNYQTAARMSPLTNLTSDLNEFCCALRDYNDCNEKLCNNKDCTAGAKDMLARIVEMTKAGYEVGNCKAFDLSICPKMPNSSSTKAISLISIVFSLILLVLNFNH